MPGASIKRNGAAPAGEPRPQTSQFGRGKVRTADRHRVERVPRGQVTVESRRRASSIVSRERHHAPAKAASG